MYTVNKAIKQKINNITLLLKIKGVFLFSIFLFSQSIDIYAFKVFPTIAENDLIYDKANYPFIAKYADGIRVQFKGFSTFSEAQVQLLLDQYTNKKIIMHGVYSGKDVTKISGASKIPSFSNFEAMFLYTEAPAMSTSEWRDVLKQNPPFPVITHCRSYSNTRSHDELREQILLSSGVIMEMRVDDKSKYDDAAEMIRYCVDNNKIASFLTTFQVSRDYFLSAYKEFYYYLKENLPARYLRSDKVMFLPNTYSDDHVFPDTPGSGGTFGVGRWLIEQKDKVGDNFLQPKVSITTPKTRDFFPDNHNLSVNVNAETAVTSVKLYLNNKLVGTDTTRPFNFSGGLLAGMKTGLYDVKAVGINNNGDEGTNVVQVKILEGALPVPGDMLPGQGSNFKSGLVPTAEGSFIFVRRNDWFDLKLNAENEGLYDVDVDIDIKRSKYFGGTVILSQGNKELGRVSSVLNDPDKPALPGFEENPKMIIKGVPLKKGVQTIRVSFTLGSTTINRPLFSLGNFRFTIQGGPVITVNSPIKSVDIDAPGNIVVKANIQSPRAQGTIAKAELFVNGESASVIQGNGPFEWNNNNDLPTLSNLESGAYLIEIVATDNIGFTNFDKFAINVIDRKPFNTSLKIPGTIEAYQFDIGGENVGYTDFNEGLERGLSGESNPRFEQAGNEDVEIEKIGNKFTVSAIRHNESLIYTLRSVEAGTYTIKALAATRPGKAGDVEVFLDHKKIGSIRITETGDAFNTYKEFESTNITIPTSKRQSNLRLVFKSVKTSSFLFFLREIQFVKTKEVNQAPNASFTNTFPTNLQAGYSELQVEVTADDPDGDAISVALSVDGNVVRSENTPPYEWGHQGSPNPNELLNLGVGNHILQATITDARGKETVIEKTITVTAQNQSPTVTITEPINGTVYNLGETINLKASATDPDGNLDKVNFKINGVFYKTDNQRPFTNTFTPDNPGTYIIAARAFDKDGLFVETSVTINVDTTLSNEDFDQVNLFNKVKLYPSPTSNLLNLDGLSDSRNTIIEIVDITGKIIITKNTTNKENQFNVTKLSKGVYFIKLQNGSTKKVLRFIKN